MEVKVVALALPSPEHFLVLHAHVNPRKAKWNVEDRSTYFRMLGILEEIYTNPKEAAKLSNEQRAALMPEGMDLFRALQLTYPCIVDANRVSKNPAYLTRDHDQAQIAELIGPEESAGVRFVVIVKKAQGLKPKPWLMQRLARMGRWEIRDEHKQVVEAENYQPGMTVWKAGKQVDLDSLEFRSSNLLVTMARQLAGHEALEEGYMKVVCMPNNIEIRLSANKSGEVVKEVAKEWG